jgi:hypothetical protein
MLGRGALVGSPSKSCSIGMQRDHRCGGKVMTPRRRCWIRAILRHGVLLFLEVLSFFGTGNVTQGARFSTCTAAVSADC